MYTLGLVVLRRFFFYSADFAYYLSPNRRYYLLPSMSTSRTSRRQTRVGFRFEVEILVAQSNVSVSFAFGTRRDYYCDFMPTYTLPVPEVDWLCHRGDFSSSYHSYCRRDVAHAPSTSRRRTDAVDFGLGTRIPTMSPKVVRGETQCFECTDVAGVTSYY